MIGMKRWRGLFGLGLAGALAGCSVVPKAPVEAPPAPPVAQPLPADEGRHRVALLVPMSGADGAAGQALANATTLALIETNATNLRITTYDTSLGAPGAAARAIADGNKLILGPLLAEETAVVARQARAAGVPVIAYTPDESVAGGNVFAMGTIPAQAVTRVVRYARLSGVARFGALVPLGDYGERVGKAMMNAVRASGGTLVGMESYDRSPGALANAVKRLKARGPYEAVLIGDTAGVAARAAAMLKVGQPGLRILGNELWIGEGVVAQSPALKGAWFPSLSDQRYGRFSAAYQQRFGVPPYRMATLGYDSVLLTLRVAREWVPGTAFPTQRLYDHTGFLGSDGIFRFNAQSVIERALEVREARGGAIVVVSSPPVRFED
jgi:branched-chain amino acid transport system substrate-binding protein